MNAPVSSTSGGVGRATTVGGYVWRREHGLLTIGDQVRLYQARRHPRGNYLTPLPEDLIDGGRK
ncbi:MAG: hypothetical protein U9Q81_01110 [Pseudomonadota bacterium]|nr:hypothetical protein [Pseudomonadota bacterium]